MYIVLASMSCLECGPQALSSAVEGKVIFDILLGGVSCLLMSDSGALRTHRGFVALGVSETTDAPRIGLSRRRFPHTLGLLGPVRRG